MNKDSSKTNSGIGFQTDNILTAFPFFLGKLRGLFGVKNILLLVFLICFSAGLTAQDIHETNSDSLLFKGIEYYQKAEFKTSLSYAERGLELAPEYHDLRILKIRNLHALREIQLAEKEIFYLLKVSPDYPGLMDLAYRQASLYRRGEESLKYLSQVMNAVPEDRRFQFLYTESLLVLNRTEDARATVQRLESIENLTGEERYRLARILDKTIKSSVGGDYQMFYFRGGYTDKGPWHNASLEYKHLFHETAFIARINYFIKDSNKGALYEIEAYPVLNENFYLHLNMGMSDGAVFPDFRGSISVYYNLPFNLELEAGGRFLQFNGDPAFMSVAGASTYLGKFYLNGRTILGPEKNDELVQNYQVNLRYYYKGTNNYLFTRLGRGISPNELDIISQLQEDTYIKANYFNLGIHFSVHYRHLIRLSAGMLLEDRPGMETRFQVLPSVGYRIRL